MGDIYHHAHLTVTASSSPSRDVKFLRKRPSLYAPIEVKIHRQGKVSLARWIARRFVRRKGTIFARRTSKTLKQEVSITSWFNTHVTNNQILGLVSTQA